MTLLNTQLGRILERIRAARGRNLWPTTVKLSQFLLEIIQEETITSNSLTSLYSGLSYISLNYGIV